MGPNPNYGSILQVKCVRYALNLTKLKSSIDITIQMCKYVLNLTKLKSDKICSNKRLRNLNY